MIFFASFFVVFNAMIFDELQIRIHNLFLIMKAFIKKKAHFGHKRMYYIKELMIFRLVIDLYDKQFAI